MKENGFTLKKQTRIQILEDTTTQVKSRQRILEQAPGGIGLYVNADKTEYMGFNQKETSPN